MNIVTLAEGDITFLHIGFKGTVSALFLKDVAEKTQRGLRGRIEDGKSGGGLCYGYRVVKTLQGSQVSTSQREIEPTEAEDATTSPETGDVELRIALVAGGGFEPPTFGL